MVGGTDLVVVVVASMVVVVVDGFTEVGVSGEVAATTASECFCADESEVPFSHPPMRAITAIRHEAPMNRFICSIPANRLNAGIGT